MCRAVDKRVERRAKYTLAGLDARLTQLWPAARRQLLVVANSG